MPARRARRSSRPPRLRVEVASFHLLPVLRAHSLSKYCRQVASAGRGFLASRAQPDAQRPLAEQFRSSTPAKAMRLTAIGERGPEPRLLDLDPIRLGELDQAAEAPPLLGLVVGEDLG